MTAREKLIEFLASNADMLTPNQAARVDALREKQAQSGALGVDVGSAPECCYCGIAGHDGDNCPTTFTPIRDCEHKDADDGCCHHPKNMTPECHIGACPRLHRRIYEAWHASLPNVCTSANSEDLRVNTTDRSDHSGASPELAVGAGFGWIDCRARLPEIGEAVFMLEPTYGPMIGSRGWAEDGWLWGTSSGNVWHNGKRWDCDSEQDADYQPTHWHPLPSLPNARGQTPGT